MGSAGLNRIQYFVNTGMKFFFLGASSPFCWFKNKEFLCITHTVEHNYMLCSAVCVIQKKFFVTGMKLRSLFKAWKFLKGCVTVSFS